MTIFSDKRKLGALAGVLAPVIFVGVFTVEGLLREGYDPMRRFVSELSLGPRGWIQISNFVITGILFLLFARGVAAEFKEGKASRWGAILLGLIGFGLLVSGLLVMDPPSRARDQWTWHANAHHFFGLLVFTLMPISCFVFFRRFRQDPKWRSLSIWTLLAGLIIVVAVVLLRLIPIPPAAPNALNPLAGLIQRTALIVFMAWIFMFALAFGKRLAAK
jgi:hypothetical protein